MNRIAELLKNIARDPGAYINLYCTANEAQAIECTAKGWW